MVVDEYLNASGFQVFRSMNRLCLKKPAGAPATCQVTVPVAVLDRAGFKDRIRAWVHEVSKKIDVSLSKHEKRLDGMLESALKKYIGNWKARHGNAWEGLLVVGRRGFHFASLSAARSTTEDGLFGTALDHSRLSVRSSSFVSASVVL